jgi:hypothetical protein
MGDREVVGRGIRQREQFVGERQARVVHYLTEGVVFHHDDKHMIQMSNTLGYRTFGGHTGTRCNSTQRAQ